MMEIRAARPGDGNKLKELFKVVDSETEFLLYEPGERPNSVEQQEENIRRYESTDAEIMLVAEEPDGKEIAGFVIGLGGHVSRNQHSLRCVIGIRQTHSGKGLGRSLMDALETWARQAEFHRMELTVMSNNHRAIALYRSCGYREEGVRKHAIRTRGEYIDEIYMSKLISA